MPAAVNNSVVNNTRIVEVNTMEMVVRYFPRDMAVSYIVVSRVHLMPPIAALFLPCVTINLPCLPLHRLLPGPPPRWCAWRRYRRRPTASALGMGEVTTAVSDLERMVNAVPRTIAAALNRKAYYFVPLTLNMGDDTMIADRYDVQLSDSAVCHRNQTLGDSQCVFISTRLMEDSFAIAFEFFINVGHNFVEHAGVSQEFADLVWKQVNEQARGETSLDAYELRKVATTSGPRPKRPGTSICWPPSPTPSPCTRYRSIWMWTTRTCANAIIPCWFPMPWPSVCARSTNSSPPIPDSSLPCITAEDSRRAR